MTSESIVFRAVRPVPLLGIEVGDDLVFDPSAPRLFTLCKRVDPAGTVIAYAIGALQALGAAPSAFELAAYVANPTPDQPEPDDDGPRVKVVK